MARKDVTLVKMVSSAKTGYFYVAGRNFKKQKVKLKFKGYDPVVRKHVEFTEKKLSH